jgi:coenzyme F420-reducing hydrogenase delta subunit
MKVAVLQGIQELLIVGCCYVLCAYRFGQNAVRLKEILSAVRGTLAPDLLHLSGQHYGWLA